MVSQKQIKAWIPPAISIFKKYMPSTDVPYPSIHIVSDKALFPSVAIRKTAMRSTTTP